MKSPDRLDILCDQGIFVQPGQFDFAALCVGGRYTIAALEAYAEEPDIKIHTLVDWPAGIGKPTVRQIEAVAAAKDGSHAIELTANQALVENGHYERLRDDLMGVVIAVREVKRELEVHLVIEAEWIGDDQKRVQDTCVVARECGIDGVVTAAGYAGLPIAGRSYTRAVEQVMKFAGPLRVKAICPPDDPDGPEAWLKRGADRVGVAASVLMGG